MGSRKAIWKSDTQFDYTQLYGTAPAYTNVEVIGSGDSAYLALEAKADNDDDIPYTTEANYTLSNGTKLEVDGGVGKLKSGVGVDHDWPFTTAGNYTLSDGTKIEISGGDAHLLNPNRYLQYHLNESSGSSASDSSGNSRDGTLTNMEDADWKAGHLNNCLEFDGVNEYIDCGVVADFDRADSFSVDAWVYVDSAGSGSRMLVSNFAKPGGTYRGWEIYFESDDKVRFNLFYDNANRLGVRTSSAISTDTWVHFVLTYDGSSTPGGVTIYFDNSSQATSTVLNTLTSGTVSGTNLSIGRRTVDNAFFYDGKIDEFVIYDKELSSAEVSTRYNSGTGTEELGYVTDNPNVYNNTGKAFTSALTSFTETATKPSGTEIKYHCSSDDGVTWKYWTGSAWAVTDNSYTQANTASDVNTNIGTLASSGTFRFRALLNSDGTGTPELDNVNIVSPSSYPTDDDLYLDTKDAVQISPATIISWLTATFTSTKPANTDIRVLFSTDGRVSWLTWGGSSWSAPASATARTDATSLTDANTNFSSLGLGSGTLDVRIFLYSSDSSVTPQIDNVNVTSDTGYETSGTYESTDFYPYDYYAGYVVDSLTFDLTTPSGTSITISAKFRYADTIDDIETDYVNYASGATIDFEDAVIIQWKATFTSDGSDTPRVNWIEFVFHTIVTTIESLDLTAGDIADAVWDEAMTDHTTIGSTGEFLALTDDIDNDTGAIKTVTDNLPNSGALTDIDTGVNNVEAKLPTNYIMGSSDQADHDDEIATILGDTQNIESKLPTNYIMGSSDQTGKDDEIDAIKAVTDNLPNSGALTDIDTGVNNIEAKLPTNYIMGSSDQNDHDTDIDSILADTNEMQGKLPTNYIMGSSTQSDKDDEIDAIAGMTTTTIHTGTAQAGGSSSITLDVGADANTNFYNDTVIHITSGLGADQARRITAYNGTTKVATISPNWVVNPDNTSVFSIYPITESHSVVTPASQADIVDDVWDEPLASHVAGGSIGEQINLIDEIDTGVDNVEAKLPTNYIMGSSDQNDHDTDIDSILADTNEVQGKLPTNYLMGSSDQNDHDTDIDAILVDTAEIQGKLPTNYIMGSSDQTDKDDEIDAIKAVTDALPNSGALSDIDTGINNIELKLPSNYIMGSSDQTDKDDDIDAILVDTNEIQGKLPDNYIMGSSVTTDKDDEIDAILADTGTDGVVVADKTGFSLSSAGIDAILDEVVEGTLTMRQMLRVFLSALAGKSTGGGTLSLTFRDEADAKARVTATVDSNGNRTAITLDGT